MHHDLDFLENRVERARRAATGVRVLLMSEALNRGMPHETGERPDPEKVIMYLCEDDPIPQVPPLAARSEASDPWLAVADMWLRMQREGALSKKPGRGFSKF
jgi:hypothetical protein